MARHLAWRFLIAGALVEVSLRGLFIGAGALVLAVTLYVALRTPIGQLD